MNRFYLYIIPFLFIFGNAGCQEKSGLEQQDKAKRTKILDHLLLTYRSDMDNKPQDVPIWEHWLKKSGELPPDFDKLESNAFPPELLKFQDGKQISDSVQWKTRRKEIKKILGQYVFGQWPPFPSKIAIKYQKSATEGSELYINKKVQLYFAPSEKAVEYAERTFSNRRTDPCNFDVASLGVELYLPKKGKGPFPVIIGSSSGEKKLYPEDLEKLRRGYALAFYSRKDADNIPFVYVDYQCTQIEWWAFAVSRCVDLLYSLPEIDHTKIAVEGHSRGGKTALLAAVMDERINAAIVSHPGTGTGSFNLWRYAGDKFGGETLENSTRRFQYWNNPRMRFFIGRENKLPFDSHFLLALMAPRACLVSTGEHDEVGEVWGDQQSYAAVKEVYQLYGKDDRLGFYASPGGHEETEQMAGDYLNWLDMQFGYKPFTFESQLVYTYSFDLWKQITGEKLDESKFPVKDLNDILIGKGGKNIKTNTDWEEKATEIKQLMDWMIGEMPDHEKIEHVTTENITEIEVGIERVDLKTGENLNARITYPKIKNGKLPVVIYLHAYLDAGGRNWSSAYGYYPGVGLRLAQNGFVAVEFDQLGYGQRNRDAGIEFYEKNKKSSVLAVMISDVSKIIDAVSTLDWVDPERIMVSGYSLGGMVGLYAAAYDKRIKAVASTCGFASMRLDVHGTQTEGIKRYSHLRPTLPRLGLFLNNEKRIPYDFHEVLALIAPRPVFILAPKLDQDWFYDDVEICYREAAKIFDLFGKKGNIVLYNPDDFNRFPPEYQQIVADWLSSYKN